VAEPRADAPVVNSCDDVNKREDGAQVKVEMGTTSVPKSGSMEGSNPRPGSPKTDLQMFRIASLEVSLGI
jgi:hypothetical protein